MFFDRKPKSNQDVMEKLFPKWNRFPANSLTSVITKYEDAEHPVVLSFLILGDDFMLDDFRKEEAPGNVDIETSLWTEDNKDKIGKDLFVRFDFYYPTGHPMFETVIPGSDPIRQAEFVNAISKIDKVYIFIANLNGKLEKVKEVSWNPEDYSDVINLLSKK